MRAVLYKAVPWNKSDVLLALESGVDGLICPDAEKKTAAGLARCLVLGVSEVAFVTLKAKADEERAAALATQAARQTAQGQAAPPAPDSAKKGTSTADDGSTGTVTSYTASNATSGATDSPKLVALTRGWGIIPLENLLAGTPGVAVEAGNLEEATLAAGVLERGADTIILTPETLPELKEIVAALKYRAPRLSLSVAEITAISPVGMGHRVCVDTASILEAGQGMLVGNSAAFTFLVNAETERNEYVAARPFRINAGGVHAYAVMPGDKTAYLEELAAGREVLVVSHTGDTSFATVGRVKVERRPMLLVEARIPAPVGEDGSGGTASKGAVFLQNAETIRLVRPDGSPVSVVDLAPGDKVLCRADIAGRHFGMRITEDIKEG